MTEAVVVEAPQGLEEPTQSLVEPATSLSGNVQAEASPGATGASEVGTQLAEAMNDTEGVDLAKQGLEEVPGAPEFYGEFDMPGDYTIPAENLDSLKSLAKELNLPQAKAQKLIDLQAAMESKDLDRIELKRTQELQDWEKAVKRDPSLGGGRFHETMVEAKRGFQRFGSPELAKLATERGIDGHLEWVKLFHSLDKHVSEDTLVQGKPAATGTNLSDVDVFFPNKQ